MLAAVVLAAGEGTRLRPLTSLRPKALCPVGGSTLLDLALARVHPVADAVAVNAAHLADQVEAAVGRRAHVSREYPALGTAGALGQLRAWLDGRDVLLTNADAYLPGGLADLVTGWDGERVRLLCHATSRPADFLRDGQPLRYVGAALMPWGAVRGLRAEPSGLYEVSWRALEAAGRLDLAALAPSAVVVDCGTPADYLAANMHASGGLSVVGARAVVEGALTRSVVWDGAYVGPGEHLVDAVRAGTRAAPVTARGGLD